MVNFRMPQNAIIALATCQGWLTHAQDLGFVLWSLMAFNTFLDITQFLLYYNKTVCCGVTSWFLWCHDFNFIQLQPSLSSKVKMPAPWVEVNAHFQVVVYLCWIMTFMTCGFISDQLLSVSVHTANRGKSSMKYKIIIVLGRKFTVWCPVPMTICWIVRGLKSFSLWFVDGHMDIELGAFNCLLHQCHFLDQMQYFRFFLYSEVSMFILYDTNNVKEVTSN